MICQLHEVCSTELMCSCLGPQYITSNINIPLQTYSWVLLVGVNALFGFGKADGVGSTDVDQLRVLPAGRPHHRDNLII